jgi:2-oxoglutarate/2-oxoacid ferredoxin oxidoreductase subunit beta
MANKTLLNIPNWCPGCGDFAIWTAFKNASAKQGWDNTNTVVAAGIGCHGHIVNFLEITAFEGLHGRALPVASGIKMANHKLNVFVFTGDGDSFSEGGNHLIHTARRNHDITVILHDNAIYGLTTGQTSSVSPIGFKSKSSPQGNIDEPLHPLTLAITAGATFAARAYSGDIDYLEELIIKANEHKGFSIIEILQPCVTFNKEYSHYFFQNNIYKLDESYDPTNRAAAIAKSMEWPVPGSPEQERKEKQIPIGIFLYLNHSEHFKEDGAYEDHLKQLKDKALVENGPEKRDISELFKSYS